MMTSCLHMILLYAIVQAVTWNATQFIIENHPIITGLLINILFFLYVAFRFISFKHFKIDYIADLPQAKRDLVGERFTTIHIHKYWPFTVQTINM